MKYNNIFLALITSALCMSSLSSNAEETITREPYIQLTTESSQVIVWRTEGEITPVVRIGTAIDKLDILVPEESILVKTAADLWKGDEKKSAPKNTMQFEASISDLKPNTVYYYALYNGDQRLTPSDKSYRFKTHPAIGSKTESRFWIVGDSGTGGKAQEQVHDGMRKYLGDRMLDGYLHVGDMAYGSGTDVEFTNRFFKMYDSTLRNTTCWASMGNHEGRSSRGKTGIGPYYDAYVLPAKAEAGGVPSGTETYYSFDFANVHFICLNSHDLDRGPTAAMAQWLKSDLEKTKADWLVAFWHHPPYTKGSHDSDKEKQLIEMRENIMPILESGGVDVVYTGHSHIYERSMLIDGAYQTPSTNEGVVLDDGDGDPNGDGSYRKSAGLSPNNGTIQVVAGHGGTGLRRKSNHVLMSKIIMLHGSVIMETKENKLTLKMINVNGEEKDLCVIEKGGKVERSIVANPKAPTLIDGRQDSNYKGAKMPKNHQPVIEKHAEWEYLAGSDLHPAIGAGWTKTGIDTSQWKKGKAGFGYGDKDDNTILDMKGKFTVVYTRKEFALDDLTNIKNIGIAAKYDDGFIAYINGVQVVRCMVDSGSGATAKGFHTHEADKYEFFSLEKVSHLFKKGKNVIAIEGHNANLGSSDFTLDAFLTIKEAK